jgi:hypothetical protein
VTNQGRNGAADRLVRPGVRLDEVRPRCYNPRVVTRGSSSAGRASRWQREGQGFESPLLHYLLQASSRPAQRQRGGRLAVFWALLVLALVVTATLSRAQNPDAPQVQITVISTGQPTDDLAVAYAVDAKDPQIQQDLAELAKALGSPPIKGKISRTAVMPGQPVLTAVEAKVPGLTNWSKGLLNIDPLAHAYRRFGRMRISYLLMGEFHLAPSEPEGQRPPIRWERTVDGAGTGQAIHYDIWVDQSRGVPAKLPSAVPVRQPWWRLLAGGVALIVFVACVVFVIASQLAGRRRAAAGTAAVRESSE